VKVIIDTSIWSIAFRRRQDQLNKNEKNLLRELKELLNEVRTVIIGPIRQEILSGISDTAQYEMLREGLSYFNDEVIQTHDYEFAAEIFNTCRQKGIQGSHIDFLICAVALHRDYSIFTSDKDFLRYKKHCGIELHIPRKF